LPDVTFLVVKFQSGKMVMLMITPMFVCLYDQQEPSLCASRPICFTPNYYISYVVMFCKKRDGLLPFNIYKKKRKQNTVIFLSTKQLCCRTEYSVCFEKLGNFSSRLRDTESDDNANLDRN
jgi:hypothetical protein